MENTYAIASPSNERFNVENLVLLWSHKIGILRETSQSNIVVFLSSTNNFLEILKLNLNIIVFLG